VTGVQTCALPISTELSGFIRTIQSELGLSAPAVAAVKLLRLRGLRENVERRLSADSARLMNVFSDAEKAFVELVPALEPAAQREMVPLLEAERKRDRYGEHGEFFAAVLAALAPEAARTWRMVLEADLEAGDLGGFTARLLQDLCLSTGDLIAYAALEARKPPSRQDTLRLGRILFDAGQPGEALGWLGRPVPEKRLLTVNGISVSVGPEYERRERMLLQAECLDALKRRDEAQALRWAAFLETFDAATLRRYLARLDDFAEFEEMDRAVAAALETDRIDQALAFLVGWPKYDTAALLVERNATRWDGRNQDLLASAADMLETDQPLAAVILYRTLIDHILDRGQTGAYEAAAGYVRRLAALASRLEGKGSLPDHEIGRAHV
jgi:hypothetical protein